MTENYIGQIMMTGFPFPPKGWAQCNGQILPISQNQALFALLGVTYGGNGSTTFCLPDLRSRTPVGAGSSNDPSWVPTAVPMGKVDGSEVVTLVVANLPMHNHMVNASSLPGNGRNPKDSLFAESTNPTSPPVQLYAQPGAVVALNQATVVDAGGNLPHSNLQPYSTINFCIALNGIWPSRD